MIDLESAKIFAIKTIKMVKIASLTNKYWTWSSL